MKVVVGEADYGQAVEKQLRDYKRKANVPGFRPGMVPMGIVKKMSLASKILISAPNIRSTPYISRGTT